MDKAGLAKLKSVAETELEGVNRGFQAVGALPLIWGPTSDTDVLKDSLRGSLIKGSAGGADFFWWVRPDGDPTVLTGAGAPKIVVCQKGGIATTPVKVVDLAAAGVTHAILGVSAQGARRSRSTGSGEVPIVDATGDCSKLRAGATSSSSKIPSSP